MKEVKPKPLAKLTEVQLHNIRSLDMQVNTLGNAIERAFRKKQEFMEDVRKAYELSNMDFHIDTRTGEVFETWPKA